MVIAIGQSKITQMIEKQDSGDELETLCRTKHEGKKCSHSAITVGLRTQSDKLGCATFLRLQSRWIIEGKTF